MQLVPSDQRLMPALQIRMQNAAGKDATATFNHVKLLFETVADAEERCEVAKMRQLDDLSATTWLI